LRFDFSVWFWGDAIAFDGLIDAAQLLSIEPIRSFASATSRGGKSGRHPGLITLLPGTLDDAMGECPSLGQGGPYSERGWQLPSLSELTSVDSEAWTKQRAEFEQYKIPALIGSEIDFWTSTPWLGRSASWSVVQFSARTTIAHPVAPDRKAAVWCVRGYPARGVR
jgi:hypothetical protein